MDVRSILRRLCAAMFGVCIVAGTTGLSVGLLVGCNSDNGEVKAHHQQGRDGEESRELGDVEDEEMEGGDVQGVDDDQSYEDVPDDDDGDSIGGGLAD